MLRKIVSGGQTGADIAGIDAAIANGVPYGGCLPKGRQTENGPLDEKYQIQEMPTCSYPRRTEQNVKDSDGTVIFFRGNLAGGSDLTRRYAIKHGKPWLHLDMTELSIHDAAIKLELWIEKAQVKILNVAGCRASNDPQIYENTFAVISDYLKKTEGAMELTENKAAFAYARAWNRLNCADFLELLADDCHYASQWVFSELESKEDISKYLIGKMQTVKATKTTVHAELGVIKNGLDSGSTCVFMTQQKGGEIQTVIVFKVAKGKIERYDMCMPELFQVERSGIYPI